MAKLTKSAILELSKKEAYSHFADKLSEIEAIQVGDFDYAIPVVVDGNIERWVKMSLTAKDTITDDEGNKVPYDPFIEVDRWDFKKEDQAARKAERERKHAEVLKRAAERKAKAKAKADAKKAKAGANASTEDTPAE